MAITGALIIEFVGVLLVLLAFWANTTGRWSRKARIYFLVNLVGAILLGIAAFIARRWGFLLLEIVWAGISLAGLLTRPKPHKSFSDR
ncbi:MAG: CBU_0592 family membrane protein [Armatimonadota bacterium]